MSPTRQRNREPLICGDTILLCIITIYCLINTICLSNTNVAFAQADSKSIKTIISLPYPFSTVVEYEPEGGNFFGRYRKNSSDFFLSINAKTNKEKVLKKLPSFDGWYRAVSAVDLKDKKFYFS